MKYEDKLAIYGRDRKVLTPKQRKRLRKQANKIQLQDNEVL